MGFFVSLYASIVGRTICFSFSGLPIENIYCETSSERENKITVLPLSKNIYNTTELQRSPKAYMVRNIID